MKGFEERLHQVIRAAVCGAQDRTTQLLEDMRMDIATITADLADLKAAAAGAGSDLPAGTVAVQVSDLQAIDDTVRGIIDQLKGSTPTPGSSPPPGSPSPGSSPPPDSPSPTAPAPRFLG